MASVRCPECGGRTTLRTSKISDISYYVCNNYPECKGRVPVEGSVYTEIGGGRSMGRPRMEDLRRQRDEHATKGMVLADEPPTNIWNKEGYSSKPVPSSPQQKKPLAAAANLRKGELSKTRWPRSAESSEYRERRQSKRAYPDGGAPRAARNTMRGERASAGGAHRAFGSRDAAASSWGDDWGDDSPAPKTAGEKLPRQAMAKGKPGAAGKKPLGLQRKKAAERGISREKKEAPEPRRERMRKKTADAKPRRPEEPQFVDEELRQIELPEDDAPPVRKKPSPIVIIAALVVAFLAIDGIIYAAAKLISD